MTLPGAFVEEDVDALFCPWELVYKSRWSQVRWGLWHFRHLWSDGHCFRKWPGLRQFRQNPFLLKMVNIWSWDNDLNFLQEYKGCLLSLQATHRSSTLTVYNGVCGNISFWPQVFDTWALTHEWHFQMPELLDRGRPAGPGNVWLPWSLVCAVATWTLWLDPVWALWQTLWRVQKDHSSCLECL